MAIGRCRALYDKAMPQELRNTRKIAPLRRAAIETAFIIFLFYSNLLMGEFTASSGRGKSLAFALKDILTGKNFLIAIISALGSYVVFESLRKNL